MSKALNTTVFIILSFLGAVILVHSWGFDWEVSAIWIVATVILSSVFWLRRIAPPDDGTGVGFFNEYDSF